MAEAEVFMGDVPSVGLVPDQDLTQLVPALVQGQMTAEVVYLGPLQAPIAKGQRVAELVIHMPNMPDARLPLVAEADVGKGGFLTRITTAAQVLYGMYWPAQDVAS